MITEADIWKDADTPGDKFVLSRDGYFRPVSATELALLGIPLTVALGRPVSKADRDVLDAVRLPVPVDLPPIVTPPITGHISADINTGTWHLTGSIG